MVRTHAWGRTQKGKVYEVKKATEQLRLPMFGLRFASGDAGEAPALRFGARGPKQRAAQDEIRMRASGPLGGWTHCTPRRQSSGSSADVCRDGANGLLSARSVCIQRGVVGEARRRPNLARSRPDCALSFDGAWLGVCWRRAYPGPEDGGLRARRRASRPPMGTISKLSSDMIDAAKVGSISTDFGCTSAHFDRIRPNLGRVWPWVDRIWPNRANSGQLGPQFGRAR